MAQHYVTDVVTHHALRRPDAPCVEELATGEALTWRGFEGRVAAVAGVLADDFGVAHGDRVAVLALNSTWMLAVQFACMRLGAIFVPLNFRLAQPELEFFCTDSESKVLLHDATWAEMANRVADGAGIKQRSSWGVPDAAHDLPTRAARSGPRSARPLARYDDTVSILYTSGTTGRPKGALCTHRTMHYNALNSIEPYGLTPNCRYLAVLPFFHAAGLNSITHPLLSLGGSLLIAPGYDPAQVVDLLADPTRGITQFSGAPVMYQVMSTVPGFDGADFSHLRHRSGRRRVPQLRGDESLPRSRDPTLSRLRLDGDGPDRLRGPPPRRPAQVRSCGAPVQYTHVRVVGEDGQDVAVGETGEVWAHGPAITPGYWRRDTDETADEDNAFAGEWFRTGDAVVQDDEGFLTIVDRYKDMYKSGGECVFPAEVERILHEHPDIADAAVIPIPDARWGEVGRALLVPRAGVTLDPATVATHCRDRLAGYKVPAEFLVIEPFTRNVTGKIPKAELKAQYG